MYYIRVRADHNIPLCIGDSDPEDDYIIRYKGTVVWDADEKVRPKKAATFMADVILGSQGYDEDIIDACDAQDQEIYEAAEAIYRPGDIFSDNPMSNRNVLYLRSIAPVRSFHGLGVTLNVIQRLASLTSAAVTLYRVDHEEAIAEASVREHLSGIGFQPLPRIEKTSWGGDIRDVDILNDLRRKFAYRVEADEHLAILADPP